MLVFDWQDRYPEALDVLMRYYEQGRLKTKESVIDGIEHAPQGLIALFAGQNFGKQLVKLA